MTFTVTIPTWLPFAYLAVGAVLWLPLEYLAWRRIHNPDPFWTEFRSLRRHPLVPLVMVVAWPVAVWEEFRPRRRRS